MKRCQDEKRNTRKGWRLKIQPQEKKHCTVHVSLRWLTSNSIVGQWWVVGTRNIATPRTLGQWCHSKLCKVFIVRSSTSLIFSSFQLIRICLGVLRPCFKIYLLFSTSLRSTYLIWYLLLGSARMVRCYHSSLRAPFCLLIQLAVVHPKQLIFCYLDWYYFCFYFKCLVIHDYNTNRKNKAVNELWTFLKRKLGTKADHLALLVSGVH